MPVWGAIYGEEMNVDKQRVYIREFLNKPGHHSTGHILAYVEETTLEKAGCGDVEFIIGDCSRQINLSFNLDTPEDRENSLYKLDLLLDSITRFKEAFLLECAIEEQRENETKKNLKDLTNLPTRRHNITMFDKYPDTEQFRNVIREVQDRHQYVEHVDGVAQYDRSRTLPIIEFIGRVKLHGTNAGIVFTPNEQRNGLNVTAQSRNNIITPENDNAGFAKFVKENQGRLENTVLDFVSMVVPKEYRNSLESVTIFGEWAGKGIQKGVAISEVDRRFYVFAIKIEDKWFVDEPTFVMWDKCVAMREGDYFTIDAYTTPFRIGVDFNRPEIAQAKLVELTNAVENQCPVAHSLGSDGIGEGIVWINADDPARPLRFKVKGEKHSTSKVKTLAAVDVEKVESAVKFAEYAATENRVKQAINEITGGEPFDIKIMGEVIKWVSQDIIKEESDVLAQNNLTMKDVGKYTGQRTREIFLSMI